MISWGFGFGYSDLATVGVNFVKPSCYLYVSGNTGDIVYLNSLGIPQFFPNAQANNIYPIAASQIVASAIVNGTSRTTTATNIVYCSTNIP
jgi:hypothetical protein